MSRNGKRRTTISDVASRAGVSTGTVSAVLNGRNSVRASTRNRVLVAIEELGYKPTPSARILGSTHGKNAVVTSSVALLIKEMDNPFYSEVALGAYQYLNERGYTTFVCTSEGNPVKENEVLDSLRERFISGAIISPLLHEKVDLSHLFMLRRLGYPFVLLEEVPGLPVVVVSVDNVKAGQMAVSYLIRNGHKRICHISGPEYSQHTRSRIQGVQHAFSESTLRFDQGVIVPGGARMSDGYEACMKLFTTRDEEELPTAVTCFNDQVAIGVLRALSELEIKVPDDVSVIGIDDIPTAEFLTVPLTTVRVPKREMGKRAAEILLQQIEDNELEKPLKVLFNAELIVRGSTRSLN